jgi:hypothetical protein
VNRIDRPVHWKEAPPPAFQSTVVTNAGIEAVTSEWVQWGPAPHQRFRNPRTHDGERKRFFLVSGADAAHTTHKVGGMIFILVMLDANRNTVPLAWAHFADNESDETWLSFLEWVKLKLPELDADNVTLVRDGRSSISTARVAHLPQTHSLYCVRHAGEAAQVNVGGGAPIQAAYTELALAQTIPQQQYLKNQTH